MWLNERYMLFWFHIVVLIWMKYSASGRWRHYGIFKLRNRWSSSHAMPKVYLKAQVVLTKIIKIAWRSNRTPLGIQIARKWLGIAGLGSGRKILNISQCLDCDNTKTFRFVSAREPRIYFRLSSNIFTILLFRQTSNEYTSAHHRATVC